MLDHYSIVKHLNFSIDLIKPVKFVCQLSYDVHKLKDPDFNLRNLFRPEFLKLFEFDFDNENRVGLNENELLESLMLEMCSYYNKAILPSLDLTKTKVLLLYEPTKSIFVLNKRIRSMQLDSDEEKNQDLEKELLESTANGFERIIKEVKFIEDFLSTGLVDEDVKQCIINSAKLGFDSLYSSAVQIKNNIDLPAPYLGFDCLDSSLIEVDLIDENDLWLNKQRLEEQLKISIGTDQNIGAIKLISTNEDIGIKYNDFVFPIKPEIDSVISQTRTADYRWIQLKEVFSKQDNRNFYKSDLISDFKKNFKNSKFSELLTHLQDNLFLESSLLEVVPKYRKYFSSALKLSDVKYLKQYNFFVSDGESANALGIYSHSRPEEGSSSYNLIHWFKNQGGQQSVYRGPKEPRRLNSKEVTSVHTLLPELSFYYISKYFEDFLESILNELSIQYISNFHLWQSSQHIGEFDFLIRHGERFIFIEAKTTLNKHNIKDYQAKCKKVINAFNGLGIKVEFLIIGFTSNETVEDLKIHIEKTHKRRKRYNVVQPDLGCIPYFFKIPISSTSGEYITCISEPNFYQIKKIFKGICQI